MSHGLEIQVNVTTTNHDDVEIVNCDISNGEICIEIEPTTDVENFNVVVTDDNYTDMECSFEIDEGNESISVKLDESYFSQSYIEHDLTFNITDTEGTPFEVYSKTLTGSYLDIVLNEAVTANQTKSQVHIFYKSGGDLIRSALPIDHIEHQPDGSLTVILDVDKPNTEGEDRAKMKRMMMEQFASIVDNMFTTEDSPQVVEPVTVDTQENN